MKLLIVLSCFILISVTTPSLAETVYVSDNLRVGVRPSPDSSIAPIDVVTSGMHLSVIEREGGYIKIRTGTGITGWVKEVYMTKDVPIREKYNELNVKYEAQSDIISKLKQSIEALTKVKVALIADLDKERIEKSNIELQLARFVETQYVDELGNNQNILIIAFIAIFGIAFLIGMFWHRYLITRRLGGLRL
ncbi:hypothetical protein MNBD_GAMMA22-2410 [hydrothermal vent metagenome]|uniref:SH3b domain-containing protein n=1 Tax=hydrothermal vent metagenome TaxID=652676 RepID=A0A3B0ZM98_9ZZZZ